MGTWGWHVACSNLPVMRPRSVTLLMPAMRPSDSVRHWPLALMLARSASGIVQAKVDARLARAKYLAHVFAATKD